MELKESTAEKQLTCWVSNLGCEEQALNNQLQNSNWPENYVPVLAPSVQKLLKQFEEFLQLRARARKAEIKAAKCAWRHQHLCVQKGRMGPLLWRDKRRLLRTKLSTGLLIGRWRKGPPVPIMT